MITVKGFFILVFFVAAVVAAMLFARKNPAEADKVAVGAEKAKGWLSRLWARITGK